MQHLQHQFYTNEITCFISSWRTCDASFTEKGTLNIHVLSVHGGKKPFKCNICDTSFTAQGTLKRHMASIYEEMYCPLCTVEADSTTKRKSI